MKTDKGVLITIRNGGASKKAPGGTFSKLGTRGDFIPGIHYYMTIHISNLKYMYSLHAL